MQFTLVVKPNQVVFNGEILAFPFPIDPNIDIIRWDGTVGTVDFKDGAPCETFSSLKRFRLLLDVIKRAKDELHEEAKQEASKLTWSQVRQRRNSLLEGCDKVMLSDFPVTAARKAEWRIYRQQLRDIPQVHSATEDVVWPAPPS